MTVEMQIEVPYFGIHWTDAGVAYLHQGRGAANFLSLRAPSPYRVRPNGVKTCNHMFPVSAAVPDPRHWEAFREYARDPLVQAMLPIPKEQYTPGLFFIEDNSNELLRPLYTLSRLSSPIEPIVQAAWTITNTARLPVELGRTNVQPLVLTQLGVRQHALLEDLKDIAYNSRRKLVMTGSSHVIVSQPIERITTSLGIEDWDKLSQMPLENLGMMVLKRFMRRDEDPLGPLPAKR